jgi:excisionase family DNA binding protein
METSYIEPFLTVAQVAKKLQVCRVTIYRFIRSGQLPAYRLGGRGIHRIEPAALAAFLAASKGSGVSAAPLPAESASRDLEALCK